jgi:hypothetical protein
MTKIITIDSLSTPDRLGYNDKGAVFFDDVLVWHDAVSTCPNPYRSSTREKWRSAYGWIAPCSTTWECVTHPKHGKCLLLAKGLELPARYPNVNHDGRAVIAEVFIHCGYTADWRGSAGCLTVPTELWPDFIKYFELWESGNISIIDKTK